MGMEDDHGAAKEGWKTRGEDKNRVKGDVLGRFQGGRIPGLLGVVTECFLNITGEFLHH